MPGTPGWKHKGAVRTVQPNAMHLLIFDPHDRGHYLAYVRYLLSATKFCERVTVVLRQGITESEAFEQQLRSSLGPAILDPSINTDSYRRSAQLRADYLAAIKRHKPDHVWIPSGDALAHPRDLRQVPTWANVGHIEAECGLVEIRFQYPPKRWRGYVGQSIDRLALRMAGFSRFHTIDPTAFEWIHRRHGNLSRRVTLVPDPVERIALPEKHEARRLLGIPETGRYVVSVGVHEVPRKGSELLLSSFARAKLRIDDRLLLAGPIGDRLRSLIAREYASLERTSRVLMLDRYLDHRELMTALAVGDVVCTPYIDHFGSSAVVLQSAQAGRPVLAPNQGWFKAMVPRFGLGHVDAILDSNVLSRALGRSLDASQEFVLPPIGQRLIEYSDSENFARLWAVRIRERMGLPSDKEAVRWEWVVAA